jgi:hypothetical protein
MKIALAIFVLATTALLFAGFALKAMPGRLASTAVGGAPVSSTVPSASAARR